MNAITAKFILKGNKSKEIDSALAVALHAVFGEGSNDKDKAASVLASIWPAVSKEVGDFEKITIDATANKTKEGTTVEVPATYTVLNLNLQAVLAGVVEMERINREASQKKEALRALYKQSRQVQYHGFEAGKRGRKSSNTFGDLLAKYAK